MSRKKKTTQEYGIKNVFLTARWVVPAAGLLMSIGVQWSPSTKQSSSKESDSQSLQSDRISLFNELVPRTLEVDGRILQPVPVPVTKAVNSSIQVYKIETFLNRTECDGLTGVHMRLVNQLSTVPALVCYDGLDIFRQHLQLVRDDPVRVSSSDFIEGTKCLNETMSVLLSSMWTIPWSYSTAFYTGESPFSHTLSERLMATMGLLPSHGGKFQVTSYPTGSGYGYHTDCVMNSTDPRDRFATVLIYLQDVPSGGETNFPELGIKFKPKKGTALIWTNMNQEGRCEESTLHQAMPVSAGYKYILQRWYYFHGYQNLGVRLDEPPIPQRKWKQARLSCTREDDCRWYDEWGSDHLIGVR